MFYLLTAVFGYLTVFGLVLSAKDIGNTLLYISACGYVISFVLAVRSMMKDTNDKK